MKKHLFPLFYLLFSFTFLHAQRVREISTIEAEGFSRVRLNTFDQYIENLIVSKKLQGAVVYFSRNNRPIRYRSYGFSDIEKRIEMKNDAIFRIASMTKAITTVGVMMLYERGLLQLNDPLDKYIPAFKDLKVAISPPAGSPDSVKYVTVPANKKITIKHLLTHTSGLGYGWGIGKEAWKKADIQGWMFAQRDETLESVINRMATLPLEAQPGEKYVYGYSTDVLGRLIEVVSEMPLDAFFQKFIFDPLKMKDTSFWMTDAKKERFAPVYGLYPNGLKLEENNLNSLYLNGPKKCFSGGAGLLSTAQDYGRFLQMLLNQGELEGVDILNPRTIQMMTTDHLGALYPNSVNGEGFGFGFWTKEVAGKNGQLSTKGAFGWGSAYYPTYFVDPQAQMYGFYFTQLMPSGGLSLNSMFGTLVYQALIE